MVCQKAFRFMWILNLSKKVFLVHQELCDSFRNDFSKRIKFFSLTSHFNNKVQLYLIDMYFKNRSYDFSLELFCSLIKLSISLIIARSISSSLSFVFLFPRLLRISRSNLPHKRIISFVSCLAVDSAS